MNSRLSKSTSCSLRAFCVLESGTQTSKALNSLTIKLLETKKLEGRMKKITSLRARMHNDSPKSHLMMKWIINCPYSKHIRTGYRGKFPADIANIIKDRTLMSVTLYIINNLNSSADFVVYVDSAQGVRPFVFPSLVLIYYNKILHNEKAHHKRQQ